MLMAARCNGFSGYAITFATRGKLLPRAHPTAHLQLLGLGPRGPAGRLRVGAGRLQLLGGLVGLLARGVRVLERRRRHLPLPSITRASASESTRVAQLTVNRHKRSAVLT